MVTHKKKKKTKASTKLILGKPLNCHHLDYQQFQARKILVLQRTPKTARAWFYVQDL